MQLFPQPFDANTVKPNEAFEPIPDAWYNLVIRNSEAKPTKDNESGYLALDIEVLDGEYKGRRLFDNLNLWNKSVQSSEIAQRQLSAYCHATGVLILQDSTQLYGIPFKGKVGIKKDEGYDAKNVIKAVKHIQDAVATQQSTPILPFGQNPSLPPPPMPTAAPTQPMQPGGPWGSPQPAPAFSPVAVTKEKPWNSPPTAQPVQSPFVQSTATAATGPIAPWRK